MLLPSLGWGEKDGTVTNSERRISRQRPFLPAPGEARADWWQLSEVARRMGFAGFDYATPAEIFEEHAALSAFENEGSRDFDIGAYAGLERESYETLAPFQWPASMKGNKAPASNAPLGGAKPPRGVGFKSARTQASLSTSRVPAKLCLAIRFRRQRSGTSH